MGFFGDFIGKNASDLVNNMANNGEIRNKHGPFIDMVRVFIIVIILFLKRTWFCLFFYIAILSTLWQGPSTSRKDLRQVWLDHWLLHEELGALQRQQYGQKLCQDTSSQNFTIHNSRNLLYLQFVLALFLHLFQIVLLIRVWFANWVASSTLLLLLWSTKLRAILVNKDDRVTSILVLRHNFLQRTKNTVVCNIIAKQYWKMYNLFNFLLFINYSDLHCFLISYKSHLYCFFLATATPYKTHCTCVLQKKFASMWYLKSIANQLELKCCPSLLMPSSNSLPKAERLTSGLLKPWLCIFHFIYIKKTRVIYQLCSTVELLYLMDCNQKMKWVQVIVIQLVHLGVHHCILPTKALNVGKYLNKLQQ